MFKNMFFILKYLICMLLLVVCPSQIVLAEGGDNIVAVVGSDVITKLDLDGRMKIVLDSLEQQVRDKTPIAKITPKVLQSLIDEKLLEQEALKEKIEVNQEDINRYIEAIEQNNNWPKGGFESMIKERKLPRNAIIAQIKGQIIGARVIQNRIRPRIMISDKEIEEVLGTIVPENAEVSFKQVTLPASEINSEQDLDAGFVTLNTLRGKIKKCDNVEDAAKKVSLSVDQITLPINQLHPDLRNMVRVLPIGNPSKVIKASAGLYLIVMCKRDYSGLSTDEKEEVREMLTQKKMNLQTEHFLHNLRKKTFVEIRI